VLSRRRKAVKEVEVEMDLATARRWLVSCNPTAALSAKGRMLCFPWAGSTAKVYSKWTTLQQDIDVVMVALPGRDG
jgi:hypothetical protein